MTLYRLGVCLKCQGDLAYDEGDWLCLQCGVYYYTGLYPQTPADADAPLLRIADPGETGFADPDETGFAEIDFADAIPGDAIPQPNQHPPNPLTAQPANNL